MVSGVSPPRPRDSPDAGGEYAIEVIDVRKEYRLGPNVVVALNGLNLRIRKGEFVAIMGPSGSGKSTLLNLIGALDRPTSGRVLIDGVDISTLDEDSLARLRNEKVGFVFQAYNLIARSTVMRNMELPALVKGYPKEERLRRIRGLLNVVGLGDKLLRRPKTLSGGEQQRVAIARALINDPSIVLADEPTGNVDSKTGRVIMGFFRKLNQERGTTIVVVTH
ncbi:ABC transporter ATP-binding protein, partial [Candidatus Bathyarchaeota archaeon]